MGALDYAVSGINNSNRQVSVDAWNAVLAEIDAKPGQCATRAIMAGIAGAVGEVLFLTESGREGVFKWSSSNLSTKVAIDTKQGVYVPPLTDTTGASGAWVRVVDNYVTDHMFGVVGDGVTDDTASLQALFDFCVYAHTDLMAVLVGPRIRTTDTVHLGYGDGFRTIHVKGTTRAYRPSGSLAGVTIECEALDRPGLAIQGGRSVVIEDVLVYGPLFDAYEAFDRLSSDIHLEATWDAAETAAGGVSSRYAPLAGIAVDPYSGVRPGTSYPDVNYPSWTGIATQYGKNFTSRVDLVNVGITGFNTGLVVQPSDADGNGDFVKWTRAFCENCKYAFSVGNGQSRSIEFTGEVRRILTCLVNNKHGRQIGQVAGRISIAGANFIGKLFDLVNSAYAGAVLFENLDFESLHRIGDITNAAANDLNIVLQSCQLEFIHDQSGVYPSNILGGATKAKIVLRECVLQGSDAYSFLPVNTVLENTTVIPEATRTKIYEQIFHNATMGGVVTPYRSRARHVVGFIPYNLSTGAAHTERRFTDEGYELSSRDYLIPIRAGRVRRTGDINNGVSFVDRPIYFVENNASTFTSVSRTNRTLQFDNAAVSDDSRANQRGYMPGDIMRHTTTGMVAVIRSRSLTTIIAELQNGYIHDGAGNYTLFDPGYDIGEANNLLATGKWEFIVSRCYTPPYPLWGTITSGSPDITALVTASSTAYDGGLVANDWLYEDVLPMVTFSGSADSKISSIDVATPKIVMGGNADATPGLPVLLDHWIRQAPANEAAR